MADYRELYAGKFLTGPECTEHPTFRIAAVRQEQVDDPENPKQMRVKVVIYGLHLRGRERPWIVCKSSAVLLAAMFGDDHEGWVGHSVTLRFDPSIKVDGRAVGGVRPLGSPELTAPIRTSIKLPRRKATQHELIPTGDPLPLALAGLRASESALAAALATLSPPLTIPTEPDRRARLAAKLVSGWPMIADLIRGTAPNPTEAPATAGGEE